MTEPRNRSKPHLVRATKPKGVPYSLVKKAILQYRSKDVPKALYRRNARAWIAARLAMGDRHVLKGHPVSWGQAGEPSAGTSQIPAPRRLGGK